ncbi:DNA polymerase processivity factor [Psittacid alphaherpesvirus 1]|uniref:DNA polymerase processivity factor n=1 Tax=Psittacid herpesvirus 1 (isolate Amazon parrot/-/97-0001/1997) TaxID=670426 RepID=PAP_PSHV1|nr:DNA polymerase processivity subunit [Psittacid alphaherpesvirus 1]Q6UDI9.1 RecName: Full=DNA polymerase processivity factor; AltName: Full=DNA-binding protein UL42; AltName: Full=Polymerase accessory protein; Short=PAP [Psittacid herpesvirus 1 Amazon parrot/1997]AAQ73721.1 DNA polymerase processivity factor [Psittacid alphaherpesvirus 1]
MSSTANSAAHEHAEKTIEADAATGAAEDTSAQLGAERGATRFDIVLGKRGCELAAPVLRAVKCLITGAFLVMRKYSVVVYCATERGLVYVDLGWTIFDQYDFLPGGSDDPLLFSVATPQNGFLLDFLCDPPKKCAQDPVLSARFLVTDSDDPEEARELLKLIVTRESGTSTKIKRAAQTDERIYMPTANSACQVALEPYSHTEITKWLGALPKDAGVKVSISDTALGLERIGCAADSVSFNAQWMDRRADRVTSCDILAKLTGVGPDAGKRSLSARSALKKLKENRVVAVHSGSGWVHSELGWPESVRVRSAQSLKKALQWLKIGAWGVPNLVFYKDKVTGLGVELSGRGEEDLWGCILFFDSEEMDDLTAQEFQEPEDCAEADYGAVSESDDAAAETHRGADGIDGADEEDSCPDMMLISATTLTQQPGRKRAPGATLQQSAQPSSPATHRKQKRPAGAARTGAGDTEQNCVHDGEASLRAPCPASNDDQEPANKRGKR